MSETEPLLGKGCAQKEVNKKVNKKVNSKGRQLLALITVEPVIFFYYMTYGLYSETDFALIYNKSCLSLYDDYTCGHLSNENFTYQENMVHTTASQWRWYLDICRDFPAMLVVAGHGFWSDRYGRRLPLVLALTGELLACAAKLYNSIYMDADITWLLLPFLFHGIFGCSTSILMSIFSYLSEVSTKKNRTLRVVIAEALIFTSMGLAQLVSGVTLDNTSFNLLYVMCVCILTGVLAYVFICLPDIKPEQGPHHNKRAKIKEQSEKPEVFYESIPKEVLLTSKRSDDNEYRSNTMKDLDSGSWRDALHIMVLFKRRTFNRRAYVIVGTTCTGLIYLTLSKHHYSILYLIYFGNPSCFS